MDFLNRLFTASNIPIAGKYFTLLELLGIVGQVVAVWLAARLIGELIKRLVFKPMRINRES
ncbi:MAG: hypothetical protein AAFP03_17070 [Cyanobacteria bacterium J06598_3]